MILNSSINKLKFKMMIIENFYENPHEVRNFALKQKYEKHIYHPGNRTENVYIPNGFYEKIKEYLHPFGCKTVESYTCSSGSFQFNIAADHSWIHNDSVDDVKDKYDLFLAGIIFLTPNAPSSGGTGFFKFVETDQHEKNDYTDDDDDYQNIQYNCRNWKGKKWELVSSIGNVFNRLILFDSLQYHMSIDYFGSEINNSRLIQLFFLGVKLDK
jgi:Family of unknown function (DUF6445)